MIKSLSRFALKYSLIPFAHNLIRLYLSLVRISTINEDMIFNHLKGGEKAIAALWHQRIMLVLSYAGRFGAYKPSVMISQSRDGDVIATVASRLNIRPVRGSSSRGGREALSIMIADLAKHPLAAHVLDGPQGPRGVIKPGLITMAQASGAPIFPVYISIDKAWVLNSWDRTLVPKPFSTITVRWDDPIYVPEKMDDGAFEHIRKQIEQHMKENQNRDDQEQGWTSPLL